MKWNFLLVLVFLFANSGCSVYRSADRSDFDDRYKNYQNSGQLPQIVTIEKIACSTKSNLPSETKPYRWVAQFENEDIWEYDLISFQTYQSQTDEGLFCEYNIVFEE